MRAVLLSAMLTSSCFAQITLPAPPGKTLLSQFDSNTPQIVLEVRMLTAPAELFRAIKADDLVRNAPAPAKPELPSGSDDDLIQNGGIQLVSATRVTEERTPVFVRMLSEQRTANLVRAVQANTRGTVLFAPKVTVFDKQEVDIADLTQRPFVVGLIPSATGMEPQLDFREEGTRLRLRTAVRPGAVRIDLAMLLSKIGKTETLEAGPEGTVVQVPSVDKSQVALSALIKEGKTLAICGFRREKLVVKTDRIMKKVPYVSKLFKNASAAPESHEMLVLITPRVIRQADEVSRQ